MHRSHRRVVRSTLLHFREAKNTRNVMEPASILHKTHQNEWHPSLLQQNYDAEVELRLETFLIFHKVTIFC